MYSDKCQAVKEQNQKLIVSLNELMKHPLIEDMDDKLIPFLGWGWRDVDPAYGRLHMSWTEDKWWIDEAGKWSYPVESMMNKRQTKFLSIW